jgi:hypothetical protein
MKKLATTFGLLALMLVVTSFTAPNEIGGKDILKSMSAYDFLKILSEDKLTPASTIIRVRRKLQEDYIDLRGKKYEERMNAGEDTRKKIKNL